MHTCRKTHREYNSYSRTIVQVVFLDFDEVMIEYPELLQEFKDNVLALYPGLRAQIETGKHGFNDGRSNSFKAAFNKKAGGVTKDEVQAMIDKAVEKIINHF